MGSMILPASGAVAWTEGNPTASRVRKCPDSSSIRNKSRDLHPSLALSPRHQSLSPSSEDHDQPVPGIATWPPLRLVRMKP